MILALTHTQHKVYHSYHTKFCVDVGKVLWFRGRVRCRRITNAFDFGTKLAVTDASRRSLLVKCCHDIESNYLKCDIKLNVIIKLRVSKHKNIHYL